MDASESTSMMITSSFFCCAWFETGAVVADDDDARTSSTDDLRDLATGSGEASGTITVALSLGELVKSVMVRLRARDGLGSDDTPDGATIDACMISIAAAFEPAAPVASDDSEDVSPGTARSYRSMYAFFGRSICTWQGTVESSSCELHH